MNTKKVDLRKYFVPITTKNYDKQSERFVETYDYIAIDSYEGNKKLMSDQRRGSITDFAIDNNAAVDTSYWDWTGDSTGAFLTSENYWKEGENNEDILVIDHDGRFSYADVTDKSFSVRPTLRLDLSSFVKNNEDYSDLFQIEYELRNRKAVCLLKMGEYPKNNVGPKQQKRLEELYNGGNLLPEMKATGRLYTTNGEIDGYEYASKQTPEFEVDGKKYVRTVVSANNQICLYHDATQAANTGEIRWKKVEPITFKITNWRQLSKEINPKGKLRKGSTILELRADQGVLAGLPFYVNRKDEKRNMWQNSLVRCFLNSTSSKEINPNSDLRQWDFNAGGFLYQAFNLARGPKKEFVVSKFETEICDYAFAGCVGIEKLVIPKHITKIGKGAFDGCSFKFAYNDKKSGDFILSQTMPENEEEYKNIIDLKLFNNAFNNFDYGMLFKPEKLEKLLPLATLLKKHKYSMPFAFAEKLMKENYIDEYVKNSDFRFLKTEMPKLNEMLVTEYDEEKISIYKFASALGCFSNKKVVDKNGRETSVLIAQKASPIFAQLFKAKMFNIGEATFFFDKLPLDVKPNQELLKFLSLRDKNGSFPNVKLLQQLDEDHPGLLVKVISDFGTALQYREEIKEDGTPGVVPWEDALVRFYIKNRLKGDENNKDMVELFATRGLLQSHLDEATRIREQAKENKIPAHILKKHLKEETILKSIERIKMQTENELMDAKTIIDDLYAKQFTYEMLDKYSPTNFIMGLYTSCCNTISSSFYGKTISKSSVLAPDVQNMVIRDTSGEIIGKGTLYVNEAEGYAVFNDFEINKKYKKHELDSENLGNGFYDVKADDPDEKARQMIFETFMRGIRDFVKEYDAEHSGKPIKRVNVGMGYNRLKRQCEKYKVETHNLQVPMDYEFRDAASTQRVLYDRAAELRRQRREERSL